MLVQKKDAELKIIEGLHNHNLGHEICSIHASWNDKFDECNPYHACNGPHFIKIVIKQLALDVNLILIGIHHANTSGNATPTDTLVTMLLTKVTP